MFKKHTAKAILLMVLSLGVGFAGGSFYGTKAALTTDSGEIKIDKVMNLYSKGNSGEVDFEQYWDVWDKIQNKYVEQPVKDPDLFYGSLKGMVNSLDDPYSKYMPPQQAQDFQKSLSGEFEGIGAEIGIRDDRLTIVAPLEGSPAKQAGLRPGDKVMAINGEDTAGITAEEAVEKIRGEKGTEVVLTVLHEGAKETEEITIVRDTIDIPTVDWEMKEDNLAYLQIRYFNQNTGSEFDEAVEEIIAENPDGLVLDLRSNPGGFLRTSVNVASEWVEKGIIVTEKSQGEVIKKFTTRGEHKLADVPTIVLVDGGTASGSEIVAGALKDHNIAKIIGKQTFGKGSVQDLEILPDGSALKLTIAKWYTPNDVSIADKGIKPDVVLEEMFKEKKNEEGEVTDMDDLGLQRAIEEIKKQIEN